MLGHAESSPAEEVGDTSNVKTGPFLPARLEYPGRRPSIHRLATAVASYKSIVAVRINCRGSTIRYALAVPSG